MKKRVKRVRKRDITLQVAEKTGVKHMYVMQIVQATLDCIAAILVKGESVEFRGFGVFKIRARKARLGRNPYTGESVQVLPKKVVVFRSCMNDLMNPSQPT